MQYTTQVLSNLVNYKSFGFTKIIPRIPEAKFAAVVEKSANASEALTLWNEVIVESHFVRNRYAQVGLRSVKRAHLPVGP